MSPAFSHILLLSACTFLFALFDNALAIAAETMLTASDYTTAEMVNGQLSAALYFNEHAPLYVDLHPQLHVAIPIGVVNLKCNTSSNGSLQCGYALHNSASPVQSVIWGGYWKEKTWGDPLNMVSLSGSARDSTRLRLSTSNYGVDIGANRFAVRWETEALAKESSKWGALALWGRANDQGDEDSATDAEHCADAPVWDADNCHDDATGEPGDLTTDGSHSLVTGVLPLDKTVVYASSSDNRDIWQWRAAVAEASVVDGPRRYAGAWAIAAKRQEKAWRMEWQVKDAALEFHRDKTHPLLELQGIIAGSTGVLAAELKSNWQRYSDTTLNTWRVTLGGHKDITAGRIVSVFVPGRVRNIKKPAWRLQAEWKLSPGTPAKPCTEGRCPWLVSADSLAAWALGMEGAIPLAGGGLAVRFAVGESRSGRMNWWYTGPMGERLLSPVSDTASRLDVLADMPLQAGIRCGCAAVYAEEVQFAPKAGERSSAVYWLLQPKCTKEVNEQVTAEYSLSWYGGSEYIGAAYRRLVPSARVSIRF